jgi:hypothetical protein
MNFLLLTVALLGLAALQARLPELFGVRLELLPALVAYGALTFRRGHALALALAGGFAQDALSAAPFGITALAFGIATVWLSGLRDVLDRQMPPLQFAAGAFVSAAASGAAFFVAGFSLKLFAVAAVAGVVTPVLFVAADRVRHRLRTV